MQHRRGFCLAAAGLCSALAMKDGVARDTLFNPALLDINQPADNIDIRQFNHPNTLSPGSYKIDIYINERFFDKRDVRFVVDSPDSDLHPCFVAVSGILREMGVKAEVLKEIKHVDETQCIDPRALLPDSAWSLNGESLVLNVNIPQALIDTTAHNYVSPDRWDAGINAMMLSYDFSGATTMKSSYGDNGDDFYYLGLNGGINLGAWRLRNYATLNANNGSASYQSVNTYLQRDVAALRSQAMVGDAWTSSEVFDGIQMRGVRLYTDDAMLPDSETGFAPVVRGIAKSNATVTIRQNNYIIYQTVVPQGAFEIADLNSTNTGGDLDVTITEENGDVQHFIQPYASLAIMRREGRTDVDISAGEIREQPRYQPYFTQVQVLHGFSHGITLYGGAQIAEDYQSAALGMGKDMGGLGALSVDVTEANADLDGGSNGQSYRFLYSKVFAQTDTHFRLVGYRYSTEGFYSLNDWVSRRDDEENFLLTGNRRSRIEGTWTQPLPTYWGSFYLTVARQDYWYTNDVERMVQAGYNNSWKQLSYSFSWSYNNYIRHDDNNDDSSEDKTSENMFMLSFSLPLSGWLDNSSVSYTVTRDDNGHATHQAGIYGSLMEHNNLNYSLQQNYDSQDNEVGGNVNLDYKGTYGKVSSGYSWNDDYHRLSYGASGGVIVHDGGITLTQQLGETLALISVPGAQGINIDNTNGIATDWRGYTVMPWLTPYSENRVALNKDYFTNNNVEVDNSAVMLIPTRGAVVKANFTTHIGYRVFLHLTLPNGKPVPFGALASTDENNTGIVGDNGDLYMSGLTPQGKLTLRWGEGRGLYCTADYGIDEHNTSPLIQANAVCYQGNKR